MKLNTFSFKPGTGWSVANFPAMDSKQTLVIVFAAPEFIDHPDPLSALVDAYPESKLIGCSTSGEISGPFVNDASLSVAVVQFEHSDIAVVSAEIKQAADSRAAGEQLARQLGGKNLCAVFVLSDGLAVNGSELVKGLNSA